jgi:hypothetical protein
VSAIKIAVYRFAVWDHDRGENVIALRMATLAAITQAKGLPDSGSMRLVDESELDGDGFYPRESSGLGP